MSDAYNLNVLSHEMKEQLKHKLAATTMNKCHSSCLMSLGDNQLLPIEETCFRNCFIKSAQFNKHFENELAYSIRQLNKTPAHTIVDM